MPISYDVWAAAQQERGIDLSAVREKLKNYAIELPSWGFGNSGTRFQVFKAQGAAGNLWERIEDCAMVHQLTGMTPTMAIHIPWDKVDDYDEVAQYAADRGIRIGAVNPNLFQDAEYKLGSLCNSDPAIRRKAIDHMLDCVDIMRKTGSRDMSLWLADGTNYPGQADIRARKHYLEEALVEVAEAMPEGSRLLIEYKPFEPAFYHTDIADWGMSHAFCKKIGDKGKVLVDIGHHLQGTNVEHIVAFLLDEGMLGGFHFNNRKYADDDLIVGSVNPYEIFLIFQEILAAESDPACAPCVRDIAYMVDQSHCIEPKVPAMIRSVCNIQTAYAKALLVNREQLAAARAAGDVMAAEACMREAFEQDVAPLLASIREEKGLAVDPMAAYAASGYQDKIAGRAEGSGWG